MRAARRLAVARGWRAPPQRAHVSNSASSYAYFFTPAKPAVRRPRGAPSRPGDVRERISVPPLAMGLVVGAGGRNIKELEAADGVSWVRADFAASVVFVVGSPAAVARVRRRVDQAASVAANSRAYFPDKAVSVLDFGEDAMLTFDRVDAAAPAPVVLAALDADRAYFSLREAGVAPLPLARGGAQDETSEPWHVVVGFDATAAARFFEDALLRHRNDLAAAPPHERAKLTVEFGKTYLSSVEEAFLNQPTPARDVARTDAGAAGGGRSTFFRQLAPEVRSKLVSRLGEYEALEAATRKIKVDCWREDETQAPTTVTLLDRDASGGEDDEGDGAAHVRAVGRAATLYAVLGLFPGCDARAVKIAFRRAALRVHPDRNPHAAAADAMKVVVEAYEGLKLDAAAQDGTAKAGLRRPINRVGHFVADEPARMPAVESCRSALRKLALLTVHRTAAAAEFRTTLEVEADLGDSPTSETRISLEEAWAARADGRFVFDDGSESFKVDKVRYASSQTFTDGAFALEVEETTEEWFGQASTGVQLRLSSYALDSSLLALKSAAQGDRGAVIKRAVQDLRALHEEAFHILELMR